MKVKDLPHDTDLKKIKIELPDDVLKAYQDYAGGEKHMYIVGSMMGNFFMSPHPPCPDESRQMFPMPLSLVPSDMLEWEVIND